MTRKSPTMVRNIAILSGNSHPSFVLSICNYLSVEPSERILCKFSSGESRCEIQDSVRGKDVYIIQTFGVGSDPNYKVNDYLMEVCIMIAACKGGSARRVTAVLPLFPYSRQPDLAFSKAGAPLRGAISGGEKDKGPGVVGGKGYTFESVPVTPHPNITRTAGLGPGTDMIDVVGRVMSNDNRGIGYRGGTPSGIHTPPLQMITYGGAGSGFSPSQQPQQQQQQQQGQYTTHDYENPPSLMMALSPPKPGYKQWMAQSGSLVADLLTCAGADRILTCDLHESAYQGFFDIPVDNLHARPFLTRYISQHLLPSPATHVIVSPDAGGAKRATAIADSLDLPFALIHKERRPPKFSSVNTAKATMMLVGDVKGKTCLLIDDLVDTANTLTRAAKLLKKEGAERVVGLVTHGVFSGDALERIEDSGLDKVVVTNTVDQGRSLGRTRKVEVLDVSGVFGEAMRRVHFGESLGGLFEGEGVL